MRRDLIHFLTDESGGGALEFALVSALAAIASLAAIGAAQNGMIPLLPDVQRNITQAVDALNGSLK